MKRPVLTLKRPVAEPPVVVEATVVEATPSKRYPKPLWESLKAKHPALRDKLVLAIGCGDQLLAEAPEGMEEALRRRISWRCQSNAYLQQMAEGGNRHNLDGTVAGPISPEHQQQAKNILAKRAKRK